MVLDRMCLWVYGMGYSFRTVKFFRIFIGRRMVNDYWIA